MRTALITGIEGQDGFYLSRVLRESGYGVVGVAHSAPAEDALQGVHVRVGDIRDDAFMSALFREVLPTHVFNLAAVSSVAKSWEEPGTTAEVNALAVAQLLDLALREQERRGEAIAFLQASSAEIFGQAASSPQDEKTPLAPVNPYGAAKAYAHTMTGIYRSRGLRTCSLVLYNHESVLRRPAFVTRKITRAAARIAEGGTEKLALGNMDARRDWGWAEDYMQAMALAADQDASDDFVIATGVAHSIADFVAAAFRAAGIDDWAPHVEIDQRFVRPNDASDLRGDSSKARAELGWRPTVAFDELVARMVRHDIDELRNGAAAG